MLGLGPLCFYIYVIMLLSIMPSGLTILERDYVSADGVVRPCGASGCMSAGAGGGEPANVSEAAFAPAQSADCVDADGVVVGAVRRQRLHVGWCRFHFIRRSKRKMRSNDR